MKAFVVKYHGPSGVMPALFQMASSFCGRRIFASGEKQRLAFGDSGIGIRSTFGPGDLSRIAFGSDDIKLVGAGICEESKSKPLLPESIRDLGSHYFDLSIEPIRSHFIYR
jgi:hypothetical protein